MNWYLEVLKNYVEFSGRARRKEYWFFMLFNLIITVVLMIIDLQTGNYSEQTELGLLSSIYMLAVLIPSIAVSIRRLHDTDRSGWWLLIAFVPFIGGIVMFVFTVLDSTPGDNQYGSNPKEIG